MKLHNISQSQNFILVTVWWSDLIHHNFLNPDESITAERYCFQIEKLQRLYPVLINKNGPILLYDNYHTSLDRSFKSWTNWATKSLIYHTRQISRLSITTFSSTSTISCIRNASNPREMLKRHSMFATSRSLEFYSTGTKKLVSRCIDCNNFYFD